MSNPQTKRRWLEYFIGLLDLLIACLWLAMNPQQSWLFITAFIGVEMIFSAIGLLVLRNKMKHARLKPYFDTGEENEFT